MNRLIEKANVMLEKVKVCEVASINEEGYPRVCILMSLKHQGIKTLWFSTATSSKKVAHFLKNNKAGVTFFNSMDSVTLTGKITIVDDKNVKDILWTTFLEKHFPNGGKDDPEYCVLRFDSNEGTFYIDGEFESFEV